MKRLQHFFSYALFALFALLALTALQTQAADSRLDTIIERGYILVGTTGDFKPFTYLNPETGKYEGYDIDAAMKLGEDLGVEVRFVATTWKELVDGITSDKYDIAMGGITRNLTRQKKVNLSLPYIKTGKSPLIRLADKDRFKSLADIDQPGVRIAVNPGGTNEKFVLANIKQAQIITVPKNLDIPGELIANNADVMFTDNVEAIISARHHPELYAVDPTNTYTKDDFGYMMPRDDFAFDNWVDLWVFKMQDKGEFAKLEAKWITQ